MTERTTPVITLAGDAATRGETYGESARELIGEAVERWTENIGRGLTVPMADYLTALVDRTGFRAAAATHCPELLDELAGLARASRVDERTLFAMNLLDEEWWIRRQIASGTDMTHCSGFGIPPTEARPAYVGQNMDLPGWMDGLQILLDLRPDNGPAALIPSWPGMVALDGVNEDGVGVCVNTLAQLPTAADGVPVAFMIRTVLDKRSRAEAVAALHDLPHASGQNYLVGDPTGVADIECSAAGAVEYHSDAAWIAHTNHPLVDGSDGDLAPTDNDSQGRTLPRLAHLSQRLGELDRVDAARLGAVLTETPLCRGSDGDPGFTLYSAVMELTDKPVLHLTAGPPSHHPLVAFEVAKS